VPDAARWIVDGGREAEVPEPRAMSLVDQARAAGRPVAVDVEERVAFLGVSAETRARALASLEAPDFRLPDLAGRDHTLSEQRGRKVLLVAYGSW
jgi:hypothetical protein